MRVMDLASWPPSPGVAFSACGGTSPTSADEVFIERFLRMNEGHLVFACIDGGRSVVHGLFVPDVKIAEKVGRIIHEYRGMKLFDLGFIEIPEGES
jgi:hypothetical protein